MKKKISITFYAALLMLFPVYYACNNHQSGKSDQQIIFKDSAELKAYIDSQMNLQFESQRQQLHTKGKDEYIDVVAARSEGKKYQDWLTGLLSPANLKAEPASIKIKKEDIQDLNAIITANPDVNYIKGVFGRVKDGMSIYDRNTIILAAWDSTHRQVVYHSMHPNQVYQTYPIDDSVYNAIYPVILGKQ
jgi:hypothetical protein